MLRKLLRYYHTLKYLKLLQVYYRIYYVLRKKARLNGFKNDLLPGTFRQLSLVEGIPTYETYQSSAIFTFLNKFHDFGSFRNIDWNYSDHGKLWCYHLNYFDFLHQPGLSPTSGESLIRDYLDKNHTLCDGLEPYPISLRNINWIKFLIKHDVKGDRQEIDAFLFSSYHHLSHNIEYHLMGNHLLENGFSLLFGAYYFENERLYRKAKNILMAQLDEQILSDGAHFELSPMYHQIMLYRLLDGINLLKHNPWKGEELLNLFIQKAEAMLGWLVAITFRNGDIPNVNDAANHMAPERVPLLGYAKRLDITPKTIMLKESGYRKINTDRYELFMDVGKIGPDYIPGHAHSDTFNFLLHIDGEPLMVDTGTSTYERGERREKERSTAAHNTVIINGKEQSQVWAGFRVGKRANIVSLKEGRDTITAQHDGYYTIGTIHERQWKAEEKKISIHDRLISKKADVIGEALLHFYPGISPSVVNDTLYITDKIQGIVKNAERIEICEYQCAEEFNKTVSGKKICITFRGHLQLDLNFFP